jgi:hypothetical protein
MVIKNMMMHECTIDAQDARETLVVSCMNGLWVLDGFWDFCAQSEPSATVWR